MDISVFGNHDRKQTPGWQQSRTVLLAYRKLGTRVQSVKEGSRSENIASSDIMIVGARHHLGPAVRANHNS